MRSYELMYIVDPTLEEAAAEALVGQIEEFIGKQGATIEKTERWGKRRMAYRIGRHQEGFYVLSVIQARPDSVAELERKLRVTDGVLRFITVRVDEELAKVGRRQARKSVREEARRARRTRAEAAGPAAVEGEGELETEVEPAEEAG